MMNELKGIQEYYPDDVAICYGCGKNNPHGLKINTIWNGQEGIFRFTPEPFHTAFPGVVYGGLLASLIDCHSIGTAVAAAYHNENREPGTNPEILFVTGNLNIDFLNPTPIDKEIELRAKVTEMHEKKSLIACNVYTSGVKTVRGKVLAVRVNSYRNFK